MGVTFFSVALQPKSGLGRLTVKVSVSHKVTHTHTHTHTHPVGLLCTSCQPVAEAASYGTRNKYKRRTFMSSAGIEPAIPATKRLQPHSLDRTATGIGRVEVQPFEFRDVCTVNHVLHDNERGCTSVWRIE